MQSATSEKADRAGAQWTSAELELLERPDLSATQIATMIGRTYWAVKTMRKKLHREPKLQRVVGFAGREGRL